MNAVDLLHHYSMIADAPGVVVRLRRFILDLAVRGKLAPQNPKDEPASELLERITLERSRRVMGRIGNNNPRSELDQNSTPFKAPNGWQWVRLAECTNILQGFAFSSDNFSTDPGAGYPLVKIGDIGSDTPSVYINSPVVQKYLIQKGDILLGLSGSIKCAMWNGPPALLNQRIARIAEISSDLYSRWLFLGITFHLQRWRQETSKLTVQNIKTSQLNDALLPLPPLAEQRRIVAQVDQLMVLCDQLEAARADREVKRDRLSMASLARLTAPDSETSCDDARFALGVLTDLTTRTDQIKQIRQAVLNLAMHGRLERQDPTDEPASELVKRLGLAQMPLVGSGNAKLIKETISSDGSAAGASLPAGWKWTLLGTIYDVRDGTHDTPKYTDVGYPLITSKNLSSGYLSLDNSKLISKEDHVQFSARSLVEQGDVLLAMIGSIGNPVIVDTDRPFSIKNVALFKYFDRDLCCPGFLRYFLQYAANKMKSLATGGLQPFVSLGFLRGYPISLPPIAEQHRIVAKVDEMMALCDQLEASLSVSDDYRLRLLETLLRQALQPSATAIEAP